MKKDGEKELYFTTNLQWAVSPLPRMSVAVRWCLPRDLSVRERVGAGTAFEGCMTLTFYIEEGHGWYSSSAQNCIKADKERRWYYSTSPSSPELQIRLIWQDSKHENLFRECASMNEDHHCVVRGDDATRCRASLPSLETGPLGQA